MPAVSEIFAFLDKRAPVGTKMDFDNVGLLAGFTKRDVTKIIVTLDITDDVINEAILKNAELIVSHHPLFFGLKSVMDGDRTGRKIVALLNNGVSAICMHTNLDAAVGGVNDALLKVLGLNCLGLLSVGGTTADGAQYGTSRIGELDTPIMMKEFLPCVKGALNANGLRYHDSGKAVKRVGVVGGSGGSELSAAVKNGCDTLLTADIKYDVFLEAKEEGINLIDADHFCTENVVCPVLSDWLSVEFKDVKVELSSVHGQTARFF